MDFSILNIEYLITFRLIFRWKKKKIHMELYTISIIPLHRVYL